MFHYSSSTTHGIITDSGKKIKTTNVNVENGEGIIKVSVEDHKGIHSDTRRLTKGEMKNIQQHKFMPKLFNKTLTNVKNQKVRGKTNKTVRTTKKVKK
jgi:hypothetical protein